MPAPSQLLYNALIRTHHVTSRKKVGLLKKAAGKHGCYVLIRSGGCPGLMYAEGTEHIVREWVAVVQVSCQRRIDYVTALMTDDDVQKLRYKDYQLVSRPAAIEPPMVRNLALTQVTGLFEVDSVKAFGIAMEERGLLPWWRNAMGYSP